MAQKPMLREIIENANGHCLNQDYGDFGAPAPALSLIKRRISASVALAGGLNAESSTL
jgi:hypothetical protein